MLFVRHATTPGMRAARFPDDEDADPASLARAAALTSATTPWPAAGLSNAGSETAASGAGPVVWVAPVRAARQTAAALGLAACDAPALMEADHGRWRGLTYEHVAREEPEALARWLADPRAAPHGGESLAALAVRVAGWLDSVRDQPPAVAVCDVGVIRAALGHALALDPSRTARFDLAPLSTTELAATRDGWRVSHVNRKVLF